MAQIDAAWSCRFVGALLGMSALAVLAPARATACSPDTCQAGYLLPRSNGRIPANTKALAWSPSRNIDGESDAATDSVRLVNLDGRSDDVPGLTVEERGDDLFWLLLDGELREGGHYRLEAPEDCAALAVEFEVGPAADLPTSLGALDIGQPVRGRVDVATVSGSCVIDVPAVRAEASPNLTEQASAWSDLYLYALTVDGRPYHPERSLLQRPTPELASTLFAECSGPYAAGEMRDRGAAHTGLSEGEHVVTLEARLPGEDAVVKSSQRHVTLSCDVPRADAAPAGGKSAAGCQLSRHAPRADGAAWTWCVVALALLWTARSRRSRCAPASPRRRWRATWSPRSRARCGPRR